jgi:enoyl-CoA hydratase/carnithine racemase
LEGLKYCLTEIEDQILIITINQPQVLNTLDRAAHLELSSVFDEYAKDSSLRVAIITAVGDRSFCVGKNLKSEDDSGHGEFDEFPPTGFAGICTRFGLNKPVIAAVNGAAIGGGMEIVLASDLAVAAEHATFSLPEPRVGLAAIYGGGIQRLVHQIPFKQAMRLILTGQKITAQQALEMGIVNEVVPADQVLSKARELAQEIIQGAPLAIEASKAVALNSLNTSLERSILDLHPASVRMLSSEDAKEGPLAFSEKRQPRWLGK